MADIVAPYVSQDLFLPRAFDEEFSDVLVARGGERTAPFPRKVDLWWMAICIGAAVGYPTPVPSSDGLVKFHTGAIFGREPWRVSMLELLALGGGDEGVLQRPNEVIRVAHEYSGTGLAWLEDVLRGTTDPLLRLLTRIDDLLSPGRPD